MNHSAIVVPGRYRHYKGKEYLVLGMVRHSETDEELVLYRQEYGDQSLWVRPAPMFLETIEIDGRSIPRFQKIDDTGSSDGTGTHFQPG